jgi:hypothetical protein
MLENIRENFVSLATVSKEIWYMVSETTKLRLTNFSRKEKQLFMSDLLYRSELYTTLTYSIIVITLCTHSYLKVY